LRTVPLDKMSQIRTAAQADIRQVTGQGTPRSLARELHAAQQILTAAGVAVTADIQDQPLPEVGDAVLAPVLREAVTNVLRHTTARTCLIEVTISAPSMLMASRTDGGPARGQHRGYAAGGGHGLPKPAARRGGQSTTGAVGDAAELAAQIPLVSARLRPAA
jgi:signal transduction histidine kinase